MQKPEAGQLIELIALAVRQNNVVTRPVGLDTRVVLRPRSHIWKITEGQVLTVHVERTWVFGHTLHLSGTLIDTRVEVDAWGLPPLRLEFHNTWDPQQWKKEWEECWPDVVPPWRNFTATPGVRALYRRIFEAGSRPAYEMEQVLPGADPDDPFTDPILESVDLRELGDWHGARKLLEDCLLEDLRSIDAHVHLGNLLMYDRASRYTLDEAERHYRIGVAVGEQALGPSFHGLLPADYMDNRPFLRALHGLALCRWRLGDMDEARRIASRLLWLDPEDHMQAGWVLDQIERGRPYERVD